MGSSQGAEGTRSMPGKRRREPFSISKPCRRWRDDARSPHPGERQSDTRRATLAVNHVSMRGTGAAAPAVPGRLFLHKLEIYNLSFGRKFYRRTEPSKSSGVDGVRWGSDPDSVRGFQLMTGSPRSRVCQLVRFGFSQRGGERSLLAPVPSLGPDAGPHIPSSQQQHPWLTSRSPRRRHGVPMTTPPRP